MCFTDIHPHSFCFLFLLLQAEWVALNYVPFAERSLEVVVDLYHKTACHKAVINEKVLQNIIKVCGVQSVMKSLKFNMYSLMLQVEKWPKFSLNCFFAVLQMSQHMPMSSSPKLNELQFIADVEINHFYVIVVIS